MNPEDLKNMTPQEVLELQKKNCIFCKIINKEIPSHELYSDDKVVVILDINPGGEGHCLILPKDHYQILPQIPEQLIGHLFTIAKKTSRSLLKSLGVKGTSIFVANGALAGQKAPHFMVHVIPRKQGDLLFQIPKDSADETELESVKAKLSSYLSGKPVPEEVPQIEHKKEEAKTEPELEKKEDTKEQEEKDDVDKENKKEETPEEPKSEPSKDNVNLDDIAGMFI